MTPETMTLDDALALADHASPLPHLAGEALRVLRAELERLRAACPICRRAAELPGAIAVRVSIGGLATQQQEPTT